MKMVNDPIPRLSASIDNPEVNSFLKLGNAMDVDQSKGDSKIFPQDLFDSKCNSKDADLLPLKEMNDHFIKMEVPGQDGCADVKDRKIEFGFNDLLESFAVCPGKTGADKDNKVQSSADVSNVELDLPVSQECCEEIDGSAVRDICVDEGVPVKDKILIDEADKKSVFTCPAKDEEFSSSNEKGDVEWPVPVGLKSSTDEACEKDFNSWESEVRVSQSESKNDASVVRGTLQKENDVDAICLNDACAVETLSKTYADNSWEDTEGKAPQEELVIEREVASDKSICQSSTPEKSDEETAHHSKETSDTKTEPAPEEETNNTSLPDAVNNNNELGVPSELNQPLPRQMPDQEKQVSDHFTAAAAQLLQRDNFESSFAAVGPHTGSVAYSCPIAYSDSLSYRSDASTVSTRSFAFPVLQNEWNFSPVRMQKADRRRHRGWMHGLFCCKF